MIITLILGGLFMLVGLIVSLMFLIRVLVTQLEGSTGSWKSLAEIYPKLQLAPKRVTKGETIKVGAVVYKRCASIGVTEAGLYLAAWGRSTLIPWSEIRRIGETTLFWQKWPLLIVGAPPIATIAISQPVFERIESRLLISRKGQQMLTGS